MPDMQTTLADIGTPLHTVEFCVVDLETTGGAPADLGITEIGAVKVRGGEVIGEFATLVNPNTSIPAYIAVLTGITDATVAGAPTLAAALPAFLEFSAGCVMVAHNASYDMGFLRHAAEAHHYPFAPPAVLDTARFSRAVLTNGEVPNHKLATLAAHFRAGTRPIHRALDDARATVDVLHGLLERVGGLGVTSLEDVLTYSARVHESVRRKKTLADDLPAAPGVYVFVDDRGESLYVGTSKNIRARVRSYFTASEQRTRMGEMVALATKVTPIVCATGLEASVRELRLIADRKPRYNRRSRFPERGRWLKLTVEAAPRLSLVREAKADTAAGAAYLGPITSRTADDVRDVITLATSLRTCTQRITVNSHHDPCSLAQLGRCAAPCTGDPAALARYSHAARAAQDAFTTDASAVSAAVMAKIDELSRAERFEDAGAWLARLRTYLRVAERTLRRQALTDAGEVVAAAPHEGGWHLHVIRYGRLAGAAAAGPDEDPRRVLEALMATAEHVAAPTTPGSAALPEETDLLLTWLDSPDVRLLGVSDLWCSPVRSPARERHRLESRSAAVSG